MKNYLLTLLSIIIITSSSHAQTLLFRESKQPFFKSGEWIMDISEIKIYDDDLLFGRIRFNMNKSALDTIALKIKHSEDGPMRLSSISSVLDENKTISEVGNGLVDFYSTKFKKKYTRDFFYFVSAVKEVSYLTIIIDIEDSGTFYPLTYIISKIQKDKDNFEVQLLDTQKHLSDFRLVRIQQ